MNRKDLIDRVKTFTTTASDAERVVDSIFSAITEAVSKDEKVSIAGFGTFSLKHRTARTGRNPRTGEQVQIAAKKGIAFKPVPALKNL